ncbi:MAG: cytochrome P450 [Polyangiaceae bacterium]
MTLLEHLQDAWRRFEAEITGAARDVEQAVMDAVRGGLVDVEEEGAKFVAGLKTYGEEHPRETLALLRRLQPILIAKNFAVVTRFDDVKEVLSRDDVFDVPYAERMQLITNGENFFLGMADTPRYTRDKSNTRLLARREDIPSFVQPLVAKTAHEIVQSAPGSLEIVGKLTQIVPAALVANYFGLTGPSQQQLIEWTSALFWFLFLDLDSDPNVRTKALSASKALNASLDSAIQARKSAPNAQDDLVSRALQLQASGTPGLRDLDIRNDFIGLIIGAIPTTATATALALDELLRRPAELAGAQAAARADDDTLLGKYLFEAMRFNSMTPAIIRTTNRDFLLARGEIRTRTIPAGTTVAVATLSAMFDPLRIEAPEEFRLDRSDRDYFHFGYGLHQCFGYHINQVQIPQIVKPLLLRSNLRRAPGSAGVLQKAGPFAASLTVLFD